MVGIVDLILIAVGLSMDAFAVGMTNGMTDSKMKLGKVLLIALFYGVFQFFMPLIGYYASSVLSDLIAKIAPWLSFILLAFIGGKMIFDGVREVMENRRKRRAQGEAGPQEGAGDGAGAEGKAAGGPLKIGTLALQALATSIDALAVGVTFLAADTAGSLCLNIWLDCLIIGCITFSLSVLAVYLGKAVGNRLADKAEIAGGTVLVIIGVKILLEGIL